MQRVWLILGTLVSTAALVACGTSTGTVSIQKKQLHTPLQCPCNTIPVLAQYQLPSPNTYFGGIVTGSDGNLWVPESDANKIAQVTVSGTITEFPLPAGNMRPNWIAAGPDGSLWFTEDTPSFNTVGRITTSGVITEFPLPAPLAGEAVANATDIGLLTAGPDGNIWFTHVAANVIGVMSVSGTLLRTYPIPTANSVPGWISVGSDGNMWISEQGANNIARLTVASGHIDEFPIPTPNSHPNNIIIGPDGNMWFPEAKAGKVARITPTGIITEFPMVADPTVHWLARVAVAPDGSMWLDNAMLTSPWNSEIGKFDTNGTETDLWSYPLGLPRALTIGPDGNPWFTDEANNLVVRL